MNYRIVMYDFKIMVGILFSVICVLFAVFFWSVVLSFIMMLAWNYCVPIMFGFTEVNFWTMFIFIVLIRLIVSLFKK